MKHDDAENGFWKCLEEKNADADFEAARKNEFPEPLPIGEAQNEGVTRRDFLKLMGFGVAAVSAAACSQMPVQKAVPYLSKPEEIIPGQALWYASTCGGCTAACGLLVKNREGRPIKIEGNPDSPLNRGGLCPIGQASVLDLYDSGRQQFPLLNGQRVSWDELDRWVSDKLIQAKKIRVLSHSIVSPSTQAVIDLLISKYAGAKHVSYDVPSSSGLIDAHERVFGVGALPHIRLSQADVIVSVGADFLSSWISPVEFTKDYVSRRQPGKSMSRHIQIESAMSLTGANADERIAVKPSMIPAVIETLYQILSGSGAAGLDAELVAKLSQVAQDLQAAKGRAVLLCDHAATDVQTNVCLINRLIGAYGTILDLANPSRQRLARDGSLQEFIEEIRSGNVDAVITYDCNPVYELSVGDELKAAFKKLSLHVAVTARLDETAESAHAVAAKHHFLESWDDAEPISGLMHLTQPVIRPVYDTRSAQESMLHWSGNSQEYLGFIKQRWQSSVITPALLVGGFEQWWNKTVQAGFYQRNQIGSQPVARDVAPVVAARPLPKENLEFTLVPSHTLRDGASANNPWLQELPDPITKMTWGNAASLSPVTAKKFGLTEGDLVRLQSAKNSIELPVYIQPGLAEQTVVIVLGYGRSHGGKVANGVGARGMSLMQNVATLSGLSGSVQLTATGVKSQLATTQRHHSLEGRSIVRDTSLAAFLANPKSAGEGDSSDLIMLWKAHETVGHSWGMILDLNACTGCSGCVVSCQAENNVPVVGKDEVVRQREMHWIRIDRYFSGTEENPDVVFQPMMCQHCANAPCESVCPVVATTHSVDGLNQQVYNRCVGTRYCANNCPYKVRRFNWFDYANNPAFDFNMNDTVARMALNPDIVVRSRGVMEKCSMCVQRIQEGKLNAKKEGRPLKDSDIKTACQQSCPADAIIFGDLSDPNSEISKRLKSDPRRYQVLSELNVRPAVNYLSKIRNQWG